MQLNISIEKYLPPSYNANLQLKKALVGYIDKTQAHKTLQLLKKISTQLDQYSHLKRVWKRDEKSQQVEILLCLEEDEKGRQVVMEIVEGLMVRLQVKMIPVSPPNTRQIFNEWNKYWPINFIELQTYRPIQHTIQETSLLQQLITEKDNLIVFNENKVYFKVKVMNICRKGSINHSVMQLLQEWPQSEGFKTLQNAYYLTKLRLYCPIPLCGMCAMALVHSRLDRLYFPDQALSDQIAQILYCQKLNHRVKLFRVRSD